MSRKRRSLLGNYWFRVVLALTGALVIWWMRRRTQGLPEQSDQPMIWRRDIEMGPQAQQIGETDRMEGEVDREEQIGAGENVPATGMAPDMYAGNVSAVMDQDYVSDIDEMEGEVDREDQLGYRDRPAGIVPETEAGDANALLGATQETDVEGPVPGVEAEMETAGGDDLEIIDGIGPKINTILQERGIRTFNDLANTDVARLEEIMRDNNLRIADPSTWPEQARLAAAGEWSKLDAYIAQQKSNRKG